MPWPAVVVPLRALPPAKGVLGLVAVISATLVLASSLASAQEWSSGYFNSRSGYISAFGPSLDDQPTNQPTEARWQTTDPYTPGTNPPTTERGSTSFVGRINNYTLGAPSQSNNSVRFGGYSADRNVLPGITNPSLYLNFTNPGPGGSIAYLDFALIRTVSGTTFTNLDRFALNLATADGTGSLVKLTFTPSPGTLSNFFDVGWVRNGTNVSSDGVVFKPIRLEYGALYRIAASMNGNSFDLNVYGLTTQVAPGVGITNYSVITNVSVVSGGALSPGLSETNFGRFALDWELSSTNPSRPGANYIIMTSAGVTEQTSYRSWLTTYGLMVTNTNTVSDADADGFSNVQEFAFGTSPLSRDAVVVSTATSGENFVISHYARASVSEASYALLSSTNLNALWTTNGGAAADGPALPPPPAGYLPKQWSIPMSGRQFFRIQASVPGP